MLNKKKEAIRKVYNGNVEKYDVTENGYSSEDNSEFYPDIEWHPTMHHLWRPYGLKGIENNNGWIAIESEDDLPKDSYNYWVVCSNGSVKTLNDFEYYKKYIIPDLIATHYQPIIKPLPPVY